MTDFLARLAARAVGEEDAMARPRLPTRFEDAALAESALQLPIVEDEVAPETGLPTGPPRPADATDPSETQSARGESPREPRRPLTSNEQATKQEGARPDAPRRHEDVATRRPPDPTPADPDALVARAAAPLPTPRAPDVSEDRPRSVVTPAAKSPSLAPAVVPAAPARPPASDTVAPSLRPEALPAFDEAGPTVRIHIGRLEVRANLVDPAPPPSRARDEDAAREPARLSLSDYLRGER